MTGEASQESTDTVEYTEVQQQAIEMGWNPEGVDGKNFVEAEEYVSRKPLYDEIHSMKRALKNRDKEFKEVSSYVKTMRQSVRAEELEKLKTLKKEALEADDYDKVVEIDDKILDKKAETTSSSDSSNDSPAFDDWVADNKWYEEDRNMRFIANGIGNEWINDNPKGNTEDMFKHVSKEMAKEYPEKFNQNPRRSKPSPVEGSTPAASGSKGKSKSKYSEKDLPEDAIRVMNLLVKNKTTTKQEYIKDYFGDE